ncbi:thioesterase [Candidatus Bathyarchaeota archaeon]|jgi:acyl-coenzyme A thioesterase PaaI-like protein|nr:thioesterase [Candidatus Bathyarchaeota archaeon]
MEVKTHLEAETELLGNPVEFKTGEYSIVELLAIESMRVDHRGLIHGGFTFGLADYAAMLAINHPNVVLGSSEVRFTSPVSVGDLMKANAKVIEKKDKRFLVEVVVTVGERVVLNGKMTCFVLDHHVLEKTP